MKLVIEFATNDRRTAVRYGPVDAVKLTDAGELCATTDGRAVVVGRLSDAGWELFDNGSAIVFETVTINPRLTDGEEGYAPLVPAPDGRQTPEPVSGVL